MADRSHWDEVTERAQAGLTKLGVDAPPEIARLVAEVRELGGGPQQEARAKLDLVITKGINDGIAGLVKATMALVRSSDENTNTMSKLGRTLNWLTAGLVIFSAAQVWLAFRNAPQPIQVNVPAPVVQVVPTGLSAPQQSPVAPAPVQRRSSSAPSPSPSAAQTKRP